MSSELAIHVERLGKQYQIGSRSEAYRTLRDTLTEAARKPVRALRSLAGQNGASRGGADVTIWALREVSFEVKPGEVVGIIGRNGAGKSTLLRILSRITHPTEGSAVLRGRVASLLEVGTGFHPELTGRENVFLNGAILGMKRHEIQATFDEIVAFAEVEKFIDTPVKHYSSGMYLRLAFAVAAHLEPEILLVDEVLAVGDVVFQKKCLGRMKDIARDGRTVLFVSHNLVALQTLCRRVLWFQEGRLRADTLQQEVISQYLKMSMVAVTDRICEKIELAPGGKRVRIRRARVRPENGSPTETITMQSNLAIEFEYWNLIPHSYLNLSLHVLNEEGIVAFSSAPIDEPNWHGRPFPTGLFRSVCRIPGGLLNAGFHVVRLLVVQNQGFIIYQDDILTFEVLDAAERRGQWYGKWPGAIHPNLEWTTELIEDHTQDHGAVAFSNSAARTT